MALKWKLKVYDKIGNKIEREKYNNGFKKNKKYE